MYLSNKHDQSEKHLNKAVESILACLDLRIKYILPNIYSYSILGIFALERPLMVLSRWQFLIIKLYESYIPNAHRRTVESKFDRGVWQDYKEEPLLYQINSQIIQII